MGWEDILNYILFETKPTKNHRPLVRDPERGFVEETKYPLRRPSPQALTLPFLRVRTVIGVGWFRVLHLSDSDLLSMVAAALSQHSYLRSCKFIVIFMFVGCLMSEFRLDWLSWCLLHRHARLLTFQRFFCFVMLMMLVVLVFCCSIELLLFFACIKFLE